MTANLNLTQVISAQNNRSVTQNDVNAEIDSALTDFEQILVDNSDARTITATEWTRNMQFSLEDDSPVPDADVTITVPTTTARGVFVVRNQLAFPATITISGQSATPPVVAPGAIAVLTSDGTDVLLVGFEIGTLDLSLGSLREIAFDEVPDTAATPPGGFLTDDTTPAYTRVSGATDKALRVEWVSSNVDEVQFPPTFMPPDLDDTQDVTVHLLAKMSSTNDTPTIDVQVFDAIGDTEMGGVTAALSDTLAELTVTISAANISGHPLGFLNISLVPGAHGTDVLELYAAWIEYARK